MEQRYAFHGVVDAGLVSQSSRNQSRLEAIEEDKSRHVEKADHNDNNQIPFLVVPRMYHQPVSPAFLYSVTACQAPSNRDQQTLVV